jgi:PadR family transcriptional regulator
MAKGDYLGEFEQLVLLALLRLGAGAYGMAVRREIAERAGREVAIGAVYATLDRLEAKGLVASSEAEGGAERGGRARRFFTVTGEGMRALSASREALARMWDGLPQGAKA